MSTGTRLLGSKSPFFLRSALPFHSLHQIPLCLRLQKRSITADEKPLPKAETSGPGPNQEQLPHVSEEAATTGKVTGEGGPELEQGTPVEEVLKRDKQGQEKAPKVLQESVAPKGSRAFSTVSSRNQETLVLPENIEPETPGHIFSLPELPLPKDFVIKQRYDPLIKQFTGLLMRDGKLGVAQRNLALILNHLRTTSPPTFSSKYPLLPGIPPASHLPLNPILYLSIAIDSVAPLMRFKSIKGAAGGGVALQIPIPLRIRQRRRTAINWILDAASKRRNRGSGRGQFAEKVAEEVISIIEGRSGIWERRGTVHRQGVGARANLSKRIRKR